MATKRTLSKSISKIATKSHYSINSKNATQLLKNIYKTNQPTQSIKDDVHIQNAFEIYAQVEQPPNYFVLNSMISLCLHFNRMDKIILLWDDIMTTIDGISPIQLLKCCTHCDQFEFSHLMQIVEYIHLNNITFESVKDAKMYSICISKAVSNKCNNLNDLRKLASVINTDNIFIKTALINAYGKFGDIHSAKNVFESIDIMDVDVVIVGAIMKVLINNGYHDDGLDIYQRFVAHSIENNVTHLLAIQACMNMNDANQGHQIYQHILSKTHNNSIASLDIKLKTTLMDFYGHFGNVDKVKSIFDTITHQQRSNIPINTMLKALVNNRYDEEALQFYDDVCPSLLDNIAHLFAIKACINTNDFEKGSNIHGTLKLIQNEKLKKDEIELKTTLITFYGHFHDIQVSMEIFDSIEDNDKTMITINEMLHAYNNCEMYEQCIDLYQNIQSINDRLIPDIMCFVNVLKACTELTLYHFGQQIHETLLSNSNESIFNDSMIQSNLINFYGKCGKLELCQQLFDSNTIKDRLICDAMINSFGRNGDSNKSMTIYNQYFKNEQELKLEADVNTFNYLINACNHSGDVQLAKNIWENEIKDLKVKYDSYLMTTFIDCLCRNGEIKTAHKFIQKYDKNKYSQHSNDELMWIAMLNGCKNSGDVTMGDIIYNEMSKRGFSDSTMIKANVLLRNLLADNSF